MTRSIPWTFVLGGLDRVALAIVLGVVSGCGPAASQGAGGAGGSATGGAAGTGGGYLGSGGISQSGGAGGGGAPGNGGSGNAGSGGVNGGGANGAGANGGAAGNGGAGSGGAGPVGSGGAYVATGGRAAGGAVATGGGTAGSPGGTGGRAGMGGAGGAASTGGSGTAGANGTGGSSVNFSFFVASMDAMIRLSKNAMGFGGDLSYGETGTGRGLRGADKICTEIAESSLPGSGAKGWKAFLSVAGPPVINAIDRLGNGPWYDRVGRLVAANKADLLHDRPVGADPAIVNDLPNEQGIPNQLYARSLDPALDDNHDTLTGSNTMGKLDTSSGATCTDWTSSAGVSGMKPRVGHSWPGAASGANWMSALYEGGCAPGFNLAHGGGPMMGVYTVGTGGGYGGIYCFADRP